MRAIWKGHLRFSLVTIPIQVYKATRTREFPLHLLHRPCMSRIKYQHYCPTCDRPVSNDELVRAYEYGKGKYVPIEDQELERLKASSNKVINILYFTDKNQVPPLYFREAYYVIPQEEPATEAFSLLKKLLKEKGKVAIAKLTMRQREHTVCIEPWHDVLSMTTLYYADEVQDTSYLPYSEVKPRLQPNEIELASTLIEHMSKPFELSEFKDQYREAINELISAKVGGKEIVREKRAEADKVLNLMEALRKSIETEKALLPRKGVVEAKPQTARKQRRRVLKKKRVLNKK